MKILKQNKYSILKIIAKYGLILTIAFSFLMPLIIVHAAGLGLQVSTTINNPLGTGHLETIPSFIEAILNIVLVVGVPIITLAIIYSGFLFVQAQGNPEKLKKAKQTLVYTLVGATLLLGSWVLASAIGSTVNQIKNSA